MTDWCPMIWWYRCKFPLIHLEPCQGLRSGHHNYASHGQRKETNMYQYFPILTMLINNQWIFTIQVILFTPHNAGGYRNIYKFKRCRYDLIPDKAGIYKSLQVWIFRQKLQGFPIIFTTFIFLPLQTLATWPKNPLRWSLSTQIFERLTKVFQCLTIGCYQLNFFIVVQNSFF